MRENFLIEIDKVKKNIFPKLNRSDGNQFNQNASLAAVEEAKRKRLLMEFEKLKIMKCHIITRCTHASHSHENVTRIPFCIYHLTYLCWSQWR